MKIWLFENLDLPLKGLKFPFYFFKNSNKFSSCCWFDIISRKFSRFVSFGLIGVSGLTCCIKIVAKNAASAQATSNKMVFNLKTRYQSHREKGFW